MRFYHRIFFRTYTQTHTHTHVVYQIIKYSTTTLISYIRETKGHGGRRRRAETNGCTNEFVDKNRWSLLTQVEQHDVNNLNEKHMSLCVIVAVVVCSLIFMSNYCKSVYMEMCKQWICCV